MNLLPVDPASNGNSSFSTQLPGMQLAIDSTSLGEFKLCPRKYYYSILRGLQPRGGSVHLTWGIYLHSIRERYEHLRAEAVSHDDALDRVLDWILKSTWNSELKRPWLSGHDTKNRQTIIQTTVWYLDALGRDDPFETVIMANGKPAVELSFRFDSGWKTASGESIVLCGHLDRLAKLNDFVYILDAKSSSVEPGPNWAKQFNPDNQFSLYSVAAKVVYSTDVQGIIVDGVQPMVTFSRFARHLVPRTSDQLDEWLADAQWQVALMEECAERQYWPMNDKSCKMWGGCPFQALCSRSPKARENWVSTDYEVRVWDPLRVRGDI